MGFGKKIGHAFKHVTHAPASIAHGTSHTTKKFLHETGKVLNDVAKAGGQIANVPKKVIHSVVKGKVNAAFEKKMHEEIVKVEKELAERKAQDKAALDKVIASKINQVAETYKNLTDTKALQAAELELLEMLRDLVSAIHDCRYGFKDSVEDILKFEFDDYRVVEFLKKRPLMLTLQNMATHQNSEALSILLPYFAKNFQQLSPENKSDYLILKAHVLKSANEKNVYPPELLSMSWSDDIFENANCREATTGKNWSLLHAAINRGDAKLVKYLLDHGAIVVKDANNKFPHEIPLLPGLTSNPDCVRGHQEGLRLIQSMRRGTGLSGVGAMYPWQDDPLKNPNCREPMTGYCWSLLHAAVHHADPVAAKYFLDHGAILTQDNLGRLPHQAPLWPELASNPDLVRQYQEAVKLTSPQAVKNVAPATVANSSNDFTRYPNKIAEDAKAGTITVANNLITIGMEVRVSQNTTTSTANVLSQLNPGNAVLLAKSDNPKATTVDTKPVTTNTTPTQTATPIVKNAPVIETQIPSSICRP